MLLSHGFCHIATWKQEIANLKSCIRETQAETLYTVSQELNHYTIAASLDLIVTNVMKM